MWTCIHGQMFIWRTGDNVNLFINLFMYLRYHMTLYTCFHASTQLHIAVQHLHMLEHTCVPWPCFAFCNNWVLKTMTKRRRQRIMKRWCWNQSGPLACVASQVELTGKFDWKWSMIIPGDDDDDRNWMIMMIIEVGWFWCWSGSLPCVASQVAPSNSGTG